MSRDIRHAYCRTFFPALLRPYERGDRGLDGGHAPAGIALMAGEASGLLDAWASSPDGFYTCSGRLEPSHARTPRAPGESSLGDSARSGLRGSVEGVARESQVPRCIAWRGPFGGSRALGEVGSLSPTPPHLSTAYTRPRWWLSNAMIAGLSCGVGVSWGSPRLRLTQCRANP